MLGIVSDLVARQCVVAKSSAAVVRHRLAAGCGLVADGAGRPLFPILLTLTRRNPEPQAERLTEILRLSIQSAEGMAKNLANKCAVECAELTGSPACASHLFPFAPSTLSLSLSGIFSAAGRVSLGSRCLEFSLSFHEAAPKLLPL